jgi:hypothetical protein
VKPPCPFRQPLRFVCSAVSSHSGFRILFNFQLFLMFLNPHEVPAVAAAIGSLGPGLAGVLWVRYWPGRSASRSRHRHAPFERGFAWGQPASPGPCNLWVLREAVDRRREVVGRPGEKVGPPLLVGLLCLCAWGRLFGGGVGCKLCLQER